MDRDDSASQVGNKGLDPAENPSEKEAIATEALRKLARMRKKRLRRAHRLEQKHVGRRRRRKVKREQTHGTD